MLSISKKTLREFDKMISHSSCFDISLIPTGELNELLHRLSSLAHRTVEIFPSYGKYYSLSITRNGGAQYA